MKKALIFTHQLRALALAFPKSSESRRFLHTVRVESNGELIRMVSSNGNLMFCIIENGGVAGDSFSVSVPREMVESILKNTSEPQLILTYDEETNYLSLSAGGEEITGASGFADLGAYPLFTRIFAKIKLDTPMSPSHYNPKYLMLLKKAAGLYAGQKKREAQIYQFGKLAGVYLHDKFLAVVMPMTPFNPPPDAVVSDDFLREIL